MRRFTIEQLQHTVDIDLGTAPPLLLDQPRVDRFATATDDHQWIHTDPGRAAASTYGGTIAHGFLVLAMLPKLIFQLIELPDAGMVVNFGADRLRFLHPVPVGESIELDATLTTGQARGDGALLRLRCSIRIAGTRKRALVADQMLLVLPAQDDSAAYEPADDEPADDESAASSRR